MPAISNIQLPGFSPAPLNYSFVYDTSNSGELTDITLPYGAKLHYGYHSQGNADNITDYWILDTKTLTYHDPETGQLLPPDTWTYSVLPTATNGVPSTVTKPDQGIERHFFTPPYISNPGIPAGVTYKVKQPDGSSVERLWSFNTAIGCYGNPYVQAEVRSVTQGSTTIAAAVKKFGLDVNGNARQVDESDWVAYSLISHVGGVEDGILNLPSPAWTRTTLNSYAGSAAAGVVNCRFSSSDPNEYWKQGAATLLNALTSTTVTSGATQLAYSTFEYDSATTTGNLLTEWHWDNTKNPTWNATLSASNAIQIQRSYAPTYGDLLEEIDPNGVKTHYLYQSGSHPYPTDVFDDYQGANQRHWTLVWDSATGLRTQETDADNGSATQAGYDVRGRITSLSQAGLRTTNTDYDDASRTVTVTSDLDRADEPTHRRIATVSTMDELGRAWKTHNNGTGVETRQFQRTTSGATYQVASNPYVTPSTESTMGWTRTTMDQNGRVIEVRHFSGPDKPTPWSGTDPGTTGASTTAYNTVASDWTAATQVVTDEAGVSRTLVYDGFNRIKAVVEAGSFTTSYTYDPLDSLIGVTQPGQQLSCAQFSRCFTSSSLKRLTSAANPESGSVAYTYYDAGNLKTRADARNVVTTITYDSLNRPATKSYTASSNTPSVTYCYDGRTWTGSGSQCTGTRSSPSYGRLSEIAASDSASFSSSTRYGYDLLGRVSASTQKTGGTPYPFTYQYKLNDGLSQITYPSQRTVTYDYDGGGRIQSVTGLNGSITTDYTKAGTSVLYAPHGAISSMTFKNNVAETYSYNARLQPTQIQVSGLLTLAYGYDSTQNNGNLLSQTITRGSQTWTQSYASCYDGMNRLTCASESGAGTWSQTFNYDNFGNRWVPSYSGLPSPSFEVPNANWYLANNKISSPNGPWTYDAAGNLQAISGMPNRTFDYDAENRQRTAVVNGPTTTYAYDGEGRRVSKTWNGQTTTFVYDASGNLAAEYGGPAGPAGTQYVTSDHLGSTRLVTDSAGVAANCYDYLPFGEEIGNGTAGRSASCFGSGVFPTAGGASHTEFTGKERDAETGLDFFGARYMSSAQGRFTSPDAPLADQHAGDPQSWNLYSYGRNNPLRYTDPTGNCTVDGEQHFGSCIWHTLGLYQTKKEQAAAIQKEADADRTTMGQWHGFSINGQTPADVAKNGTNQQVIGAYKSGMGFLTGVATQSLAPCPAVAAAATLR